jgi:hypothetical protein
VILDGLAVGAGDRSRGSRFNSASRYVASSQSACAALVVSEDGGLDLLPRLRPALSRAELLRRLARLERAADFPPTPPDHEREANAIEWVEKHAFYLSEEQCAKANQWIATCDQRRARDRDAWQIVRRPLQHDPSFNPDRDLV